MPTETSTETSSHVVQRTTNPAQMLFELLQEMLPKERHLSTRHVLSTCLDIDASNDVEFASAFAAFHMLIAKAQVAVVDCGLKEHIHLKSLNQIRACFTPDAMTGQWGLIVPRIEGTPLALLEATADALLEKVPEPAISRSDLAAIHAQIRSLLDDALQADLPKALRQLLVDFLCELDVAFSHYKIRGNDGVRRAAERGVGMLYILWTRHPETRQSGLSKRIWDIVKKAASLVPWANEFIQLAETVNTATGLLANTKKE
ncbi:MAG: hypothetical protein KF691_13045 [Phycisphaeraceae bacterium]|nr:hypothetical protein [Phycisphaeraceae bacterium]